MKTRKVFIQGAMDLDSDRRNVAPNFYGYTLNALTNDTNVQNTGCIENRKGNLLVTFQLPNGNNKAIGTCKDIKRNAIVYFVFNDQNMHSILRFNVKSKTIDKILYSEPLLNFQEEYRISSANIIGDLLYWTDGYFEKFTWDPAAGEFPDIGFNGPRKINMVKAYNYTNGVAVPAIERYTAITEQVLDRIKYPPVYKPVTFFTTDPSKNFNNLVGHVFQFAYSYVYDDNEISVLGPISEILIPYGFETIDGQYNTILPKLNNVIEVAVNTGEEIVKQIKLFVRELNTGDWYLYDTINKYDNDGDAIIANNIIYTYGLANNNGFYNNEVLIIQDQADLSRTFDFIGQTVDSHELLSDNRLLDGGIVENYDNIDIDVNLEPTYSDLSFQVQSSISGSIQRLAGPTVQSGYVINDFIGYYDFTGSSFSNGDTVIINITIVVAYPGGNQYSSLLSFSRIFDNTIPLNEWVENWCNDITSNTQAAPIVFYNSHITYEGYYQGPLNFPLNYKTFCVQFYFQMIDDGSGIPDYASAYNINCYVYKQNSLNNYVSSFKEGMTHTFGLQYYDRAGRHGGINKNDDSETYVNFITETNYQNISTSIKKATRINWRISHRPPDWAKYYQWCYIKRTPNFIDFYYKDSSLDAVNKIIRLKINTEIENLRSIRPNSIIPNYVFSKGDRIRFVSTGQIAVTNQWWYFPEYIDLEIIGMDITTGEIIIQDIGYIAKRIKVPTGWDYNVVQIYTPRNKNDEYKWYEIGERFNILNPHTENRMHEGMGVNQTSTSPAEGTFINGDVYVKMRFAGAPPYLVVEALNLSDYYDSDAISIGHPSAVVPDIKRQKYSFVRYSGQYLENTMVNNLSRFNFLDKENVSDEWGDIKSVKQLGLTVKVLQPRKVTSIGVGYQQLSTAFGADIPVVSSTKILSNIRPSVLGYGCSNPESVIVNDRYMYFYDINSGKAIRDDANGMDPISDRLVKTWFRNKRNTLLNSDKHFVLTSCNGRGEVFYTFISYDYSGLHGENTVTVDTIVYNENINFWTTFLSYYKTETSGQIIPPDCYGFLGETMLSFMNGQAYLEEDNPLFNNFFGVQYAMEVEVIDNADFEKEKVFQAIALATNSNSGDYWDAPIITCPPSEHALNGCQTSIVKFSCKEDGLYADTRRDIRTPMSGTDAYKLINGNPMRGQVCVYKLRNTSTGQVVLYSVIFRNISSEISK